MCVGGMVGMLSGSLDDGVDSSRHQRLGVESLCLRKVEIASEALR